MANYNTAGDVVLGQGTATYIDDIDVYIEGASTATTAGASGTDITDIGNNTSLGPAADNRFAQFLGNTSSLTGESVTYFVTNFRNSGTGNSVPVTFRNSRIHFGTDRSSFNDWFFPLELDNVDIFSSATGVGGVWGIYGNGSGNSFPTFDANGHIDLDVLHPDGGAGDGHRARSRLWTWNNVRIFLDGSVNLLLNGALPEVPDSQGFFPNTGTRLVSSFTNVDFNPVPGRGAFGELPFLPFVDARWGQFYRFDFPTGTNSNLFARLTGGMNRSQISATGANRNWMIQPQWDIRNLDGETTQVGVDGRCFVYFVNFVMPADATNIRMMGSQGTQATNVNDAGPTRVINAYGWNPVVNKFPGAPALDVKYMWDNAAFNMHAVPEAFLTTTVPLEVNPGTGGYVEPTTFNGFFVIQTDTTLTDSTVASGTVVEPYTSREVHLFSYNTQLNTITGTTLNRNFGRTVTVTPGEYQVNGDLSWRADDVINEPVDPFLNGRVLADGTPTTTIDNLDNIYPTFKAIAYNSASMSDDRLNMVPSEGSLRFVSGVVFNETSNNLILTDQDGIMIVRLQNAGTNTGVTPTLDFTQLSGSFLDVNWDTPNRTFTGPLTVRGGNHFNFPNGNLQAEDVAWPDGLTFDGPDTRIQVDDTSREYDFRNVTFTGTLPRLNFFGTRTTPLVIRNVAPEFVNFISGIGTPNPITILSAPIENIIRIPAQAGRFALLVNGTEVVAPRVFTADEITAGFVEFTASNQLGSLTELSNLTDGALIELFIKYDNTFAPNLVYQEQRSTRNFNGTQDGTLLDFTVMPALTSVLVGQAVTPPASVTFTFVAAAGTDPDHFEVSGAREEDLAPTGELSSVQSQGLAIQIANHEQYFLTWYNSRATQTDPIVNFPTNAAEWNADLITFGSGDINASGRRTQQQGADWSRLATSTSALYLDRDGAPELNFPASVQAALSTVIQAARDGLTLELDARCVTKSNVGNMGLLAPTLDADGNIIPVTPPSGG